MPRRRYSRAGALFALLHAITLVCLFAQIVIDFEYDNGIASLLVAVSATVTFLYIRRSRAMVTVPLSSFALLGLCITTQWGALLGQTVLGDSLTNNLRQPVQTFSYLLGFQLTAIAAHWTSRHLAIFDSLRRLGSAGLSRLGIFDVPTVETMWLIGSFGYGSFLFSHVAGGSLLSKVADGFAVFVWAPFVIPVLASRLGETYCRLPKHIPLLALYAALAIVTGLALNFRAFMLTGAMTALLLYLLVLLADERPLEARHARQLLAAMVLVVIAYQPVGYFMIGVQVARAERGKIDRMEMIAHTFEVLKNPALVQREQDRMRNDAVLGVYDEYYFASSMIGRLVETKFHDNSFFMVEGISAAESALVAEDAKDRVLAILPYPVLKSLELERAKFVTLYSAGDYLAYLRLGGEIGQFRTGSIFAQGIAIFGPWTPVLYFLLCLPLFLIWDVLSRAGPGGTGAVVSVVGMLLTYRLFAYGIVSESIGNTAGIVLRNQLQNVLLFALVLVVCRLFSKPFLKGWQPRQAWPLAERAQGVGAARGPA